MNIFSLANEMELNLLTQLAEIYGVESGEYSEFYEYLEGKYKNVIFVNFNKLRVAQEFKKELDPDNK